MKYKLLIIGSGGREHCLAWKLSQSNSVSEIIVSPGNAGTARLGVTNGVACSNQKLPIDDYGKLADWCASNHVDLVIVGPEAPLANGIADTLSKKGIPCFGPSSNAAQIEASKQFSKEFMEKHAIPTANFKVFSDPIAACAHIRSADYPALVVKASGLAAGKGVIVASNQEEACQAVNTILKEHKFGDAGSVVIVEELLVGEEFSVLCFTDGVTIKVMPPAQDHKRLNNMDRGPNTGGMGAYCPCPQVSDDTLDFIKREILQKVVDNLLKEDCKFVGVLYAGLMMTSTGPKVLEFNCRFGDPECQVILPLLETDLYTVVKACTEEKLYLIDVKWKTQLSALAVVMASSGYPGQYTKGKKITGIDLANSTPNLHIFEAGTGLSSCGKETVTSGGRVLAVTAVSDQLTNCLGLALAGVNLINFEGAIHRTDVGNKGLQHINTTRNPELTYAQSGVHIANGEVLVESIKSVVKQTSRPGSSPDLGGFGGLFDLSLAGYKDAILVSGTDGVGTKLLLAQSCNRHSSIGFDLVAMCVNDILTHNAEPLFFLDYFACGRLSPGVATEVVSGVAQACREAGCALIGGETAEMPGMYQSGHYDLAGFAVGALERGRDSPLPLVAKVTAGDVVIGISSTGAHSNGFSLIRKVVERSDLSWTDKAPFDQSKTLGDSLLTPTAIYCRPLLPILRSCAGVKCAAHVTGGGLTGNLPRVIPRQLRFELDAHKWQIPPVFKWLAKEGNICAAEMLSTFNCGLGMCLVVAPESAEEVLSRCVTSLAPLNLDARIVGSITPRREHRGNSPQLVVRHIKEALQFPIEQAGHIAAKNGLSNGEKGSGKPLNPKKVAVLISGTGTNLQALIDHAFDQDNPTYQIKLVISNRDHVTGLKRAKMAGISTSVIDHKAFSSREKFDAALDEALIGAGIDFVCLAGFMRLLSGWFVKKWQGKVINIHPSLLPSFKGMDAHRQVLRAGVRLTGCTVHFVSEGMDEGAIIAQQSTAVLPGDTIEDLQERVKKVEHKTYPAALDLLASGRAALNKTKNTVIWNDAERKLSNGDHVN